QFFEPLELSQGAATLMVALDKSIFFITDDQPEPVECLSLLIPAGMSVRLDSRDAIIASCNLDPLGNDFAALSSLMQEHKNGAAYQLRCEENFIAGFWQIYQSPPDSKTIYKLLDQLLPSDKKLSINGHCIDQRVVEVIRLIKQRIHDNVSVDDLADAVTLSAPRLVQLFKQQTGIPIRRYRMWHRLYVTALRIGKGENFTEAAIAAGFTDSSHFCRTAQSMFGMAPSFLLAEPNNLRIIIPDEAG
ncbi:MAG: AraC-like DNA-binding protein, partial [Pseudohongiellaceae bacterium]